MESSKPSKKVDNQANSGQLVEGDFYFENGYMVFTAQYLKRRGYCCKNNCRHCPYEFGTGKP